MPVPSGVVQCELCLLYIDGDVLLAHKAAQHRVVVLLPNFKPAPQIQDQAPYRPLPSNNSTAATAAAAGSSDSFQCGGADQCWGGGAEAAYTNVATSRSSLDGGKFQAWYGYVCVLLVRCFCVFLLSTHHDADRTCSLFF